MDKIVFNGELFAKHLKEKRIVDKKNNISISLRDACKQNGISPATMSRLERAYLPDVRIFAIACKWMNKPMEQYFKVNNHKKGTRDND